MGKSIPKLPADVALLRRLMVEKKFTSKGEPSATKLADAASRYGNVTVSWVRNCLMKEGCKVGDARRWCVEQALGLPWGALIDADFSAEAASVELITSVIDLRSWRRATKCADEQTWVTFAYRFVQGPPKQVRLQVGTTGSSISLRSVTPKEIVALKQFDDPARLPEHLELLYDLIYTPQTADGGTTAPEFQYQLEYVNGFQDENWYYWRMWFATDTFTAVILFPPDKPCTDARVQQTDPDGHGRKPINRQPQILNDGELVTWSNSPCERRDVYWLHWEW